jgi:O-antigen/teichoic acid export membrane protein
MLWSGVGTLAQAVGQFAVLAALARFVTPAEFGVVSAALIVIGLGRMVTEGFVGPALTQRPGLTDEQVRTGFALSLLTGIGCTVLLWLAAPAVAEFFRMPALVAVTRGLALMLVVQVFAVVPLALLQRELRFRAIGTAEALSFLLGFAPLGIGLAVAGAGVWSLVAARPPPDRPDDALGGCQGHLHLRQRSHGGAIPELPCAARGQLRRRPLDVRCRAGPVRPGVPARVNSCCPSRQRS